MAEPDDAEPMLAIYAPIVRDTAISFELEPPSPDEMRRRLAEIRAFAPWLVCEDDGVLIGYAYAGRFRTRPAYQWTVETTVYVHAEHRRRRVAHALYTSLFECARLCGFQTAVAGVALPNAASVTLHERLRFQRVGVFRGVGFKLGRWHDVGWWELPLVPARTAPRPPEPPSVHESTPAWRAALESGGAMVRARTAR
jgi:phosphinothricin acetyltransferase